MKTINVLIASKNPSIAKATRDTLKDEENLHIVERYANARNLLSIVGEAKPDVILLDFALQKNAYDLLENIASEVPSVIVVAVLPESDNVDHGRVLRSGARDIIQFPYPPDSLAATINRAMQGVDLDQNAIPADPLASEMENPNKTITVFSPKGGVGTSTVATNLAISLQKMLKEDVLLIDGKHQFGHVALFYNLRTGNSIADLIPHASALDEQLIRQVVVRHTSGVHVLPSPLSLVESQGIKPKDLYNVIQSLQKVFPTIIVDGGNVLDENTVTYMDSSDKVLVVLNPDIASMRDVRQFIEIAATLSYPKEKTQLVLNLNGKKAAVKREEIERILKIKTFGRIPADENFVQNSLNEGVPVQLKKPHHPISRAINELSEALLESI